jgi:hypothetical protein
VAGIRSVLRPLVLAGVRFGAEAPGVSHGPLPRRNRDQVQNAVPVEIHQDGHVDHVVAVSGTIKGIGYNYAVGHDDTVARLIPHKGVRDAVANHVGNGDVAGHAHVYPRVEDDAVTPNGKQSTVGRAHQLWVAVAVDVPERQGSSSSGPRQADGPTGHTDAFVVERVEPRADLGLLHLQAEKNLVSPVMIDVANDRRSPWNVGR